MGKHFERKPVTKFEEGGTLDFKGANIHLHNGVYAISQNVYLKKLQEIPTDTEEINKAPILIQRAPKFHQFLL